MRRFLIIAIVSVLSAVNMQAQMRWGVEAGVNTVMGSDLDKTHVGFNVGATAEYSISSHWLAEANLKLSYQPFSNTSMWDYYNDADEYISPKFCDKSSYTSYYLVLPIRVGYKLGINDNLTVNFAIGPSIGVGLWGKGHIKTYDESSNSELISNTNLSNVFDSSKSGFMSSSRFEYGASVKVGMELKKHYTIGIEYNFKQIAGKYKVVNNLDIVSLNIGYKF